MNWFMMKNFDTNERIAMNGVEPTVEKETEKAMLLKWNTEYGAITSWIPKSVIEETPVVTDEALEMVKAWEQRQAEKKAQMVKGTKVKKIGGRKVFTITSDYVTYGGVWLDNGKHVDINKLEIVADI